MDIGKNQNGHDTLVVHRATASKLAGYLDLETPWIWVLGHMPNPVIEWWQASVPLTKQDSIDCRVRLLSYDLQIPTAEFLKRAGSFDEFGLTLVQATREMPNTLDLSRIPEQQQDAVLIQNGAVMTLHLPHAFETAVIVSYRPHFLAARVNNGMQAARPDART